MSRGIKRPPERGYRDIQGNLEIRVHQGFQCCRLGGLRWFTYAL